MKRSPVRFAPSKHPCRLERPRRGLHVRNATGAGHKLGRRGRHAARRRRGGGPRWTHKATRTRWSIPRKRSSTSPSRPRTVVTLPWRNSFLPEDKRR